MGLRSDLAPLHILVADDHVDAAQMLGQLLQLMLPCRVTTTQDGVQAVVLAREDPPDVLVFDIDMPGLDGIEAARRIGRALPQRRPLAIALTGKSGLAGDLEAIDRQFDAVFSKPADIERLVSVITGWRSPTVPSREPVDFAELFTVAARQVVPQALAKRLGFSFDYRGPAVVFEDDADSLRAALHRILCGVVDMLQDGFVAFSGEAERSEPGSCRIVITAAGAGALVDDAALDEVVERLALYPLPERDLQRRERAARGTCPNTGAALQLAASRADGVLIRAILTRTPSAAGFEDAAPNAGGARAWLIDRNDMASSWLLRRLQRTGWAVARFDHCEDAMALLAEPARRGRAPALVVAVEGPQVTAGALRRLAPLLPKATRLVYAVAAGSPTLTGEHALPGVDLRVYPFSPGELDAYTRQAAAADIPASGTTQPAPLGTPERPYVLVADDNDVNRIVARELLQALGYEVATADNGLEAIEYCKQQPPRAVLMDLDMPVLGGLDATRRLRALQKSGTVAPFSIVAATADDAVATRQACLDAGMDGYLSKPLSVSLLQQELKRVATLR